MVKTQGVVHFSIPVTDLDRGTAFYTDVLGMRLLLKTPKLVFLRCGDDYVILAKSETVTPAEVAGEITVHHAFKVAAEDFEPSIAFLRENAVNVFQVEERKDGVFLGRMAYFRDPDGNTLEIHDPRGIGVD